MEDERDLGLPENPFLEENPRESISGPQSQSQSQSHEQIPPVILMQQSSHPLTSMATVAFKSCALLFYILADWISSNFVLICVVEVLLLAADFWVVKNVSGRRLVGLRWWSDVLPDGTSSWRFEVRSHSVPNAFDARLFWGALYAAPALWSTLAVLALLRLHFEWMFIPVLAMALAFTNLVGYLRCDRDGFGKQQPASASWLPIDGVSSWLLRGAAHRAFNSAAARV